jgi:hypothetical protein
MDGLGGGATSLRLVLGPVSIPWALRGERTCNPAIDALTVCPVNRVREHSPRRWCISRTTFG